VFAGVLEWVIAFGFTFYLLTFFYDLHMAKGVEKGLLSKEAVAPHTTEAIAMEEQP
jgi:hypothetical protein